MRSGALDRWIRIDQPIKTTNGFNEPVSTWSELTSTWAEKVVESGAEKTEAAEIVASTVVSWRIRYDPLVTEQMRIVDDTGVNYQILEIIEEGRKWGQKIRTIRKDNE